MTPAAQPKSLTKEEGVDGRGIMRIGAQFHRRLTRYTDFWSCAHGTTYPDICSECGAQIEAVQ
jgi:hypothetical protein